MHRNKLFKIIVLYFAHACVYDITLTNSLVSCADRAE